MKGQFMMVVRPSAHGYPAFLRAGRLALSIGRSHQRYAVEGGLHPRIQDSAKLAADKSRNGRTAVAVPIGGRSARCISRSLHGGLRVPIGGRCKDALVKIGPETSRQRLRHTQTEASRPVVATLGPQEQNPRIIKE